MPEWLVQPLTFWVDLATITAIVVGGIWAYLLFVRRRQKYPRAALTHHIVHRRISHDELPDDKVLLRVGLVIENPGEVLLSLISGETRVQQIEPWPEWFLEKVKNGEDPVEKEQTEVNWPYAAEPGERGYCGSRKKKGRSNRERRTRSTSTSCSPPSARPCSFTRISRTKPNWVGGEKGAR